MVEAVLENCTLLALWAGLATGALMAEVIGIIFERRALKLAGLNSEEIEKIVGDE